MAALVLGMHRSGTSAATRLINLLGVPLSRSTDLTQPAGDDRKGSWESRALTALNDELLFMLGGSWAAPPTLSEGWFWDARLEFHRELAQRTFEEVYSTREWIWKDPRNCLLLPFWRDLLNVRPVVVLCHRSPLDIAASLRPRKGFHKLYSLALWERYLRCALHNLRGLPVLVIRHEEVVSTPLAACERMSCFLSRHAIHCPAQHPVEQIEAFVDAKLGSVAPGPAMAESDPSVTASQHRLFLALEQACGAHDEFDPPKLPDESETTEPLLAERRRADLGERRRRMEVDELQSECARLRTRLERSEAEHHGNAEELARAQEELREIRRAMTTAEETIQVLSAELVAHGEKTRAQLELVQRLHLEVANRENMIRSMRGTGMWRLRRKLRRLTLRESD